MVRQRVTDLAVNRPRERLPGYDTLQVEYGQKVGLKAVSFHYEGPNGVICVCWAPKPRHAVDFNNGEGIPGGPVRGETYGYVLVEVPSTQGEDLSVDFPSVPSSSKVLINPDIHVDNGYNSWVWAVSGSAATTQEDKILRIDDDANVFDIATPRPVVSGLEVGYAVVD